MSAKVQHWRGFWRVFGLGGARVLGFVVNLPGWWSEVRGGNPFSPLAKKPPRHLQVPRIRQAQNMPQGMFCVRPHPASASRTRHESHYLRSTNWNATR